MAAGKLFALVLAAGGGSRFGGQKLLQPYRGTPLVRRAVRLAESLCGAESVLVTGSRWRAVFETCAPLEGFLVRNDDWESGLGSSITAGVGCIRRAAGAALVILADQPLITQDHLGALVARWNGSTERIVATAFADVIGPPALFPAAYFGALMQLQGDRGARPVLAAFAEYAETITFEPAGVDIDQPEDLARLR
ncbi:MAG TPA: nucleotidyltransferase family protein [Woeseiaceae bacterium]|nr:nucleotidyltransferase family protein [Woeseiaceae bacterium]